MPGGGVFGRLPALWRYGGAVATEASPYRPIPAFRYLTDAIVRLKTAPGIDALVVHPAIVYAAEAGVAAHEIAAQIQRRFGLDAAPKLRDVEDAVGEHGPWAHGPALDQRLSGAKLRERLGWRPAHVDLLAEIGAEAA